MISKNKTLKVTGIVVEYNPFHNGHRYHIAKARELTACDVLIAIMSPTFMQRGEPAILNKFIRTRWALENDVDLVVELPTYYALESAERFAQGAITLLNELGVDYLCFGSESNDITNLKRAAALNQNERYQAKVKTYVKKGIRYANACNEALKDFNLEPITQSNDILALSYLQAIAKYHFDITPVAIKRTNAFLDTALEQNIVSAQAIRQALWQQKDITRQTPVAPDIIKHQAELVFLDDYFPLLKYQITCMGLKQLQTIHHMVEGLEHKIKKEINHVHSLTELVDKLSSKRYPKTRVQRLLIYILLNLTGEEIRTINIDYLRILGMNARGQNYLKQIKKHTDYQLVTSLGEYESTGLTLELRAAQIYALAKKETHYLNAKEYQQHVIIVNNKAQKKHV